jgi:hypothetical protein
MWLFALLVILALCTAQAAIDLSEAVNGRLRWDGERFHWSDAQDHAVTRLQCALDLQRVLLLRITCEAGPRMWLWLYSPAMDGRWRAVRRAVVCAEQNPQLHASDSLPG